MSNDLKDQSGREEKAPGERERDAALIKPQKPSLIANLRSSFFAGIVVAAPVGITVALIYWFVTGPMAGLDKFVRRALPAGDSKVEAITQAIPGFGVLVAIIVLILLGAFAKNFIGRAFIRTGEQLLDSMPVVRTLYRFFKNVFETALQQSARSFQQVGLVEYPRPGMWTIAFVVGETKGEVRYRLRDESEDTVAVFVPTVPNPTSGFLLFVPRQAVRLLSMTVEEGAKAIFSVGLVVPEFADPDDAVKQLETIAAKVAAARKPVFRLSVPGRGKSSRNGEDGQRRPG